MVISYPGIVLDSVPIIGMRTQLIIYVCGNVLPLTLAITVLGNVYSNALFPNCILAKV